MYDGISSSVFLSLFPLSPGHRMLRSSLPFLSVLRVRRRSRAALFSFACILFLFVFVFDFGPSSKPSSRASTGTLSNRTAPPRSRRISEERSKPDRTVSRVERQVESATLKQADVHQYNENGLVTVDPFGPHPIFELIRKAEERWADKHRRVSKTLGQAVKEYRRRYRREPPAGFDLWWDYVRKHKVQLPDEYDQIYEDLEAFWGIDPIQLQISQQKLQQNKDTYTIGKLSQDDPITILFQKLPQDREESMITNVAIPQIDLLEDIEQFLPPFQATFTPHDNPELVVDHLWKSMAVEAARNGSVLRFEDFPSEYPRGWAAACHPNSSLAQNPPALFAEPSPQTRHTFIHSHTQTMDICNNPQHLLLHGEFLRRPLPPNPDRPLAPLFSNCKTSVHADILATPTYLSNINAKDVVPWELKPKNRLLWRGSPTGMWHASNTHWRNAHRARLLNMTGPKHRMRQALILPPAQTEGEPAGSGEKVPVQLLNEGLTDMKFSGSNQGCAPETCAEMRKVFHYGDFQNEEEAANFKFHMDVDGNGWSGRFHRLMSSNSLIFKSTIYREWYADRVEPWVHYVPIQLDYSDLYSSMMFFAGDFAGRLGHDDLAKNIASTGKAWTEKYWRQEDMTAYMFRLYLEYARVMSPNRAELYYHHDEDA